MKFRDTGQKKKKKKKNLASTSDILSDESIRFTKNEPLSNVIF